MITYLHVHFTTYIRMTATRRYEAAVMKTKGGVYGCVLMRTQSTTHPNKVPLLLKKKSLFSVTRKTVTNGVLSYHGGLIDGGSRVFLKIELRVYLFRFQINDFIHISSCFSLPIKLRPYGSYWPRYIWGGIKNKEA